MRPYSIYKKTNYHYKKWLAILIFMMITVFIVYTIKNKEIFINYSSKSARLNPLDPAEIIRLFLEQLYNTLFGQLVGWFYNLGITFIVIPFLALINLIYEALNGFSAGSLQQAIFGGEGFNIENIPYAFWAALVSVPLCLVLVFMFHFFSMIEFDSTTTLGVRFKRAGSASVKLIVYIFVIPVGFYMLIFILQVGSFYIAKYMSPESVSNGGSWMNWGLTDSIALACGLNINPAKDTAWDRYSSMQEGGGLIGGNLISTFILTTIIILIMVVIMLFMFLSMIERVFYIFMGLIVSVYFACAAALDGGAKLRDMRNSYFAKTLALLVIILTFQFAPFMANAINTSMGNSSNLNLIYLIVICGVMLSIIKIAGAIETKIGESSNYDRIAGNSRKNTATVGKAAGAVIRAKTNPVGFAGKLFGA